MDSAEPAPIQRATVFTGAGALPRVCAALGFIGLFYALWLLYLPSAASWPAAVDWSARALRVIPRVSVFMLGTLLALLLQGRGAESNDQGSTSSAAIPAPFSSAVLLCAGLLGAAGALLLLNQAENFELVKIAPAAISETREAARRTGLWSETSNNLWIHAQPGMFAAGTALLFLRFVCGLLSAVFLGLWAGRGVSRNWQFLALIFCAAVGDAWFNAFRVADTSALRVMRLPFLPALAGFVASPPWTDIFFVAAVLEAARSLRLHAASLALGAVAGYCSAAFLALEPAPGISVLSMTLMGSGIMAGAWPDLKLDSAAVGKAFLTAALLILMLSGFAAIQRKLNPPAKPVEFPEHPHNVAENSGAIYLGFAARMRPQLGQQVSSLPISARLMNCAGRRM